MRKYFLLSAVAVLMATNVNAETGTAFAEINTYAEIEYAYEVSCSEMNFGKIILKNNKQDSWVTATGTYSENVLSVTGNTIALCSSDDEELIEAMVEALNHPEANGYTLTTSDFDPENGVGGMINIGEYVAKSHVGPNDSDAGISATIYIPEGAPAGIYTGYVPVSIVY